MRASSASRVEIRGNLAKDLSAALVDAAAGNLRLTPRAVEAIDRGARSGSAGGHRPEAGRRKPDLGAYELRSGQSEVGP